MKPRQFIQRLEKFGVSVDPSRGKGGHYRAEFQDRWATIKVHGSKDLTPAYMKLVCKQLGIDPQSIL